MSEELVGMRVFKGISGEGLINGNDVAPGIPVRAGDRLQITWVGGASFGVGGPTSFGTHAPADDTITQLIAVDLSAYWYAALIYRQTEEEA